MEEDFSKKRFLWGLLLAWAPWVPTLVGIVFVISSSKATGLGLVAGGLTELLIVWGIVTMIVGQVAAIVWLFRSLSKTHIGRSLVAAASICASAATLFVVCAFLFWGRRVLEHASSR